MIAALERAMQFYDGAVISTIEEQQEKQPGERQQEKMR